MAEPQPLHVAAVGDAAAPERRLTRQMRARLAWRAVVAWLTGPAVTVPGVAALGCAVTGSWLLWGAAVALLVAVPFLLLLDARS